MVKNKRKKIEETSFKSVKVKNVKSKGNLSYEGQEILKFIIIFVAVIVVIVGIYFLSAYIVNKRETIKDDVTVGEIKYDVVSVGTVLNRPYENYYVLVYDSKDTDAIFYSSLISNYSSKEDGKKIYFCDLNNRFNTNYKSENETGNIFAKTVDEFSFSKITLLEVSNMQIVGYEEDVDTIKTILQ